MESILQSLVVVQDVKHGNFKVLLKVFWGYFTSAVRSDLDHVSIACLHASVSYCCVTNQPKLNDLIWHPLPHNFCMHEIWLWFSYIFFRFLVVSVLIRSLAKDLCPSLYNYWQDSDPDSRWLLPVPVTWELSARQVISWSAQREKSNERGAPALQS